MRNERWRVRVAGAVQGVGFRPFIWRLAMAEQVTGLIRNDPDGVLIEVQGDPETLRHLVTKIKANAPPLAIISKLHCERVELATDEASFRIEVSNLDADPHVFVSPDVSVCEDCLAEIHDPTNRRYRYPFTNCTNCGPRYTIVRDLPYDRVTTTMSDFEMCPSCNREYTDPTDRRYHAEPIACGECGPSVWFTSKDRSVLARHFDAIKATKLAIANGSIVAIKGIGGFHLACDATNHDAVKALRTRKHRFVKPLAIMVADTPSCERFAFLNTVEQRLIESRQRPIVLLRKRPDAGDWCERVAPKNDRIGVMLAYSPLHALLVDPGQIWVMTSANLADEPITYDNEDAWGRLQHIADAFLYHDRRIETVCDDSVLVVMDGHELPIRRSRGYAPLPIQLPSEGPAILAVGAEYKATVCVAKGSQCFLSQHIGDMSNQETLFAMQQIVDHLLKLYQVKPDWIVADLHPGYLSSAWAERFAKQHHLPLSRIQHHHAHVGSLMAEHSLAPDKKIIGVCFDGTGYGTDGAVWGGEWLIANGVDFQRFAHLSYVPLVGGDHCIRHPARMALAHLFDAGIEWSDSLASVQAVSLSSRRILLQQLQKNIACVPTSSMGRLFDAVASLCSICQQSHYEGQAAMEAEAIAATALTRLPGRSSAYSKTFSKQSGLAYDIVLNKSDGVLKLDSAALIRQIVADLNQSRPAAEILARFHVTIAEAIVKICLQASQQHSIARVGLTGGVFQNTLLTSLARERLIAAGFEVLTHLKVPPNDGGLSLGQAWIGRQLGFVRKGG